MAAPQEAREKAAWMVAHSIHVYSPSWKSKLGDYHSPTMTECVLKIHGATETMTIPVQTCTRVCDVKAAVAGIAMAEVEALIFVAKQGCTHTVLKDQDECAKKVVVRGIKSFKPLPRAWPHPTAIVGLGYNGVKAAMFYMRDGDSNFVCFDRNDRVGGYNWITAANKTSKLQTDFASFHVWYGPEFSGSGKCGGFPTAWEFWPSKARVLEHFHLAAQDWGVLPHCRFERNVEELMIVGRPGDDDRAYRLSVADTRRDVVENMTFSIVYHWPGSMTKNRVVSYSGEELFGGEVRYGMGDDLPYDDIPGSFTAILGNGAFAIENVRTCCEYGARGIYLVTRRKNLPSPRVPCWIVHQSKVPVPGALLLELFAPMFQRCGLGDPWQYWSVHANAARSNAHIIQGSRFGIGDVFFLAVAYGRAKIVQGLVKRLSRHTLHLEDGGKLSPVSNIIKALGLVGDFDVDRLHSMKEVVGMWCGGDYRRPFGIDPPGLNAANFSTFSAGIGIYSNLVTLKHVIDHPYEYKQLVRAEIPLLLPRHKRTEDMPAYLIDIKHAMASGILVEATLPRVQRKTEAIGEYKHMLTHKVCPLGTFLEVCEAEWDAYQERWREEGFEHEYIPYPYTRDRVQGFTDSFSHAVQSASTEVAVDVSVQDRLVSNEWWRRNSERGEDLRNDTSFDYRFSI